MTTATGARAGTSHGESPSPALTIADYALLSDCQGSALVGRNGSIDWACLPRFDSPAFFSRLLGTNAGHWLIAPVGGHLGDRSYIADTMVLRTTWRTPHGTVALTDALALAPDERGHHIGRHAPHVVLRVVEGIEGTVEMAFEFVPRPEYGLTVPVVVPGEGGLRTRGGPQALVVSSTIPLNSESGAASARWSLRQGDHDAFALRVVSPWESGTDPWSSSQITEAMESTIAGWRSWSALHQSYQGPYAENVRNSGRLLQALTYAPTGAVVAAPTASLPEETGGVRNWDYRYCWVRDASLTLTALWVAACPDEARDFFDFLATAAGGQGKGASSLQILYGIGGERLVPEHELAHLDGFADSRPVRIGNGAWNQTQLDVYGELLGAAALLAPQVGTFDRVTADFLIEVAETAARRWQETDQGIWEVRGESRHFLYSKLMCWVALDRAIALASVLGAEKRVTRWTNVREQIREAIETQGWSERLEAFTQAFGADDLDASNLMMLIFGFLPADDPRMRSTVEAIARALSDERGFVYRYRAEDGLEGGEGTFAICTFWLVRCLAMMGQVKRARELFDRLVAHANDVGLMSEEIDAKTGLLLGNFPQAFTHIGLVNAAWTIAEAEARLHRDDSDAPAAVRMTAAE